MTVRKGRSQWNGHEAYLRAAILLPVTELGSWALPALMT